MAFLFLRDKLVANYLNMKYNEESQ